MQKYVAILEDKIQWIAIGLGALFVLFMTWTYVLNSPASVEVNNEKLGPGEIDEFAVQHAVNQYDAAIQDGGKIQIEVPKHVKRFQDQMNWRDASPVTDMAIVYGSQPKDVEIPKAPPAPGQPVPPGGQPPVAPGPQQKVAALPVIPAPKPGDVASGRSMVIPPPVAGQPAPPPPQPGQVDPNAVAKDWVTQVFKVDLGEIDKAFTAAQIPAGDLRKTLFLQVTLEREELDSDGKPVPNTLKVIEPLAGVARNPGQPVPPYPPPGQAGMEAAVNYLQWAAQNQPDIIEPVFYTTVQGVGAQWQKPGPPPANAQTVFDPATFTGSAEGLPPDQKEAVLKYRREKYKADQDAKKAARPAPAPRTSPRGPTGGPGMEMEGGRTYAPAPVAPRPPVAPPHAPVGYPPGVRPGAPPFRPGGFEGDMEGGFAPPPQQVQGLPTPGQDYPNQDFDPGAPEWKTKTVEIWAHDTTIEAGKTYHYRIKYKLKNPLFGTNAGATQQLNTTFDLASKDGPWASPITIPQKVNFFVQSSKAPGGNTVRFDIYKWEGGSIVADTFAVGPGDQVGAPKNGVDYSTDWTVVDFRPDARQNDTQILLVNNKDGKVMVRSFQGDSTDPLYKALKNQMNAIKAAGPAAGATP